MSGVAEGLEERARQWLKDHNWAFEDLSERDLVANEMAEFAAEVRRETMEQCAEMAEDDDNPHRSPKLAAVIRSRMEAE